MATATIVMGIDGPAVDRFCKAVGDDAASKIEKTVDPVTVSAQLAAGGPPWRVVTLTYKKPVNVMSLKVVKKTLTYGEQKAQEVIMREVSQDASLIPGYKNETAYAAVRSATNKMIRQMAKELFKVVIRGG